MEVNTGVSYFRLEFLSTVFYKGRIQLENMEFEPPPPCVDLWKLSDSHG